MFRTCRYQRQLNFVHYYQLFSERENQPSQNHDDIFMIIVIQPRHVSFSSFFSSSPPNLAFLSLEILALHSLCYPIYTHIPLTLSHHNSNIFKLFYLPLLKLSLSLSITLSFGFHFIDERSSSESLRVLHQWLA